MVWLRDPRPYFRRGTYAVADALVSTDCIDVPADKADKNGCSHVNFNTGVLHFRPTDAAKAFVQTWKTKVATSTIAWMRDQPAFNLITHEGVGGHSLVPAVRVPSHKRGADGHRMVYYAANATLRLGVLPNWLFGNGHTYFVQWHHLARPEDGEPYSVHMTYQYGDTGEYAYGKRERMRQAGIWRADPRAITPRVIFSWFRTRARVRVSRATRRWAPTARRTRRPFVDTSTKTHFDVRRCATPSRGVRARSNPRAPRRSVLLRQNLEQPQRVSRARFGDVPVTVRVPDGSHLRPPAVVPRRHASVS